MRKMLIGLCILTMLLAPTAAGASTGAVTDPEVLQQVAQARRESAKYHDVERAIADGYVAPADCVDRMGYHYYDLTLIFDPAIDPMRPEVLIYAPTRNGLKLVAFEYVAFDAGQPRPAVFGRPFDGPSHGAYTLHAWLWQANPDGMFAPYNPNVSCAGVAHE